MRDYTIWSIQDSTGHSWQFDYHANFICIKVWESEIEELKKKATNSINAWIKTTDRFAIFLLIFFYVRNCKCIFSAILQENLKFLFKVCQLYLKLKFLKCRFVQGLSVAMNKTVSEILICQHRGEVELRTTCKTNKKRLKRSTNQKLFRAPYFLVSKKVGRNCIFKGLHIGRISDWNHKLRFVRNSFWEKSKSFKKWSKLKKWHFRGSQLFV